MISSKKWCANLFCVAMLLFTAPTFANVIIGLPADTNNGNCFPFGCSYSGQYQQVYTASEFSSTITISDLEFFNTVVDLGATSMNTGNWTISLSTTTADWNTLSSTYADNIGADNIEVFSGNLFQPWAFGDTLHIDLTTPFTYDPLQGNLLMDVFVSGASSPGGIILFDTSGYNGGNFNGNTIMGRVWGSGDIDSGYGLVTGFSTTAHIPEPATLALFGIGLAGLGFARKKKNSA